MLPLDTLATLPCLLNMLVGRFKLSTRVRFFTLPSGLCWPAGAPGAEADPHAWPDAGARPLARTARVFVAWKEG